MSKQNISEFSCKSGVNSALCLRFDLDTFSSRHAYIADVGWGAYSYLPRILQVAAVHKAKFQFCACGQGMAEYPFEIQTIKQAGHPIDSHLYSHRVVLTNKSERVTEELVLTEQVFDHHKIPFSGIGATGMYPNGIDDCSKVQALLTERGYQWCSTKYHKKLPLEKMQPYWLNEHLLEIPCAGMSDRNWFYDDKAPLDDFISHVLKILEKAAGEDLIYAIDLHPGVLAKYDPECKFVTTIVERAVQIGVPLVTMDQISQWKIARREIEYFNTGDRVGDTSAYGHNWCELEKLSNDQPLTIKRYLEAETTWNNLYAQPMAQPEKVFDYIGGWRVFPNTCNILGVKINRFGLRGNNFLRTKAKGMTRIMCIGDSCVFGIPPEDAPWPAQLQIQLDQKTPLEYQVINAGVNGQSSLNIYLRLPQLLRILEPDMVFISVLANDAWAISEKVAKGLSNYVPKSFIQNIQWSIDVCKKFAAIPVLITPPGMVPENVEMTPFMLTTFHQASALGEKKQPEKMRKLYDIHNDAIRELAKKNEISCIDSALAFDETLDNQRGRLFFDTCHMLKESNMEMGKITSEYLLPILSEQL